MQTDGRRDKTKLIVALRYFANGPKIQSDMFGEIIAVCSQIHTKHIKPLCGQNVDCSSLQSVHTSSHHSLSPLFIVWLERTHREAYRSMQAMNECLSPISVCGVRSDKFCDISYSRHVVVVTFVLLRCYAAAVVGSCLPTFWANLSFPS